MNPGATTKSRRIDHPAGAGRGGGDLGGVAEHAQPVLFDREGAGSPRRSAPVHEGTAGDEEVEGLHGGILAGLGSRRTPPVGPRARASIADRDRAAASDPSSRPAGSSAVRPPRPDPDPDGRRPHGLPSRRDRRGRRRAGGSPGSGPPTSAVRRVERRPVARRLRARPRSSTSGRSCSCPGWWISTPTCPSCPTPAWVRGWTSWRGWSATSSRSSELRRRGGGSPSWRPPRFAPSRPWARRRSSPTGRSSPPRWTARSGPPRRTGSGRSWAR